MSDSSTQYAADVPETMRAAVLTGVGAVSVRERPTPRVRPDEVLVKVAAVGVCGSDVHYYREGRIGDHVVKAPLVLGHEAAGRIVAAGAEVDPGRVGERVAIEPQRPCRACRQCKSGRYNLCPRMEFYGTPPVDGAFCEYVTIQADFAHPVLEAVSDEAAALLEPLSVAIWSIRKAGVVPGSRVLIAGAGPIGVLVAQTARAFGAAEIVITDPLAERREFARRLGATSALDPAEDDVGDLEVDAFIDASGATRAVVSGMRAVRSGGAVVLVGMGADTVPMPIPIIQNRELTVTGVFRYAGTWPTAAHLTASGEVDLDCLVTGRFSLDETEKALTADGVPGAMKAIVAPS